VVDRKLEEKEDVLCESLKEIVLLKESLVASRTAKKDLLFLCEERVAEVRGALSQ
jgi:hypothetical protein